MGTGVGVGRCLVGVAGARVAVGVREEVGDAAEVTFAVGEAVGRGVSLGTGVATTGITNTCAAGAGGGVSVAP